jgi:oligoendopeptidase F
MSRLSRITFAFFLLLPAATLLAQDEATEVDPKYTWDLTEIYPSLEAWEQARDEVLASFEDIEARRGTLGNSAEDLYETLALISDTTRKAARVSTYSSLNADEDLRVTETQERRQLGQIMFSRFNEATAWVQPETLRVGEEVINAYLKEDGRLERFRFQLEDSLRNAPHTLGDEAEETLAFFSQAMASPFNIYGMVANSDIPWPTVTLSTGEEGRIDSQGYSRYRQAENRDDRKQVFDAFWGKWLEYRNSVGAVLNSHLQNQVALAKARNYDSVLQRELFADNLPEAVYRTLVAEVNAALPTLHRYFKLRTQMLGLDEMR